MTRNQLREVTAAKPAISPDTRPVFTFVDALLAARGRVAAATYQIGLEISIARRHAGILQMLVAYY